jgi:alpha-methylacyl-CoA racemase
MAGPLAGLLVLDFSTLLPGPLASLMLSEAGAEVVKVERPGGEDMTRFPPAFGDGSAAWAVLNRGKRVIHADLKDASAIASLMPLVRRADVLVEQFRPGVMQRLGLGFETLRALNPRLVYCSITGYGQEGPRAQEAGHDVNYQAVTGLLSQSPGTPEAPALPPSLTADIAGGAMPAVMNILLALRERDQTGQGRHLDIAMADAMFTFAWYGLVTGRATGTFPGAAGTMLTGGSPRYRLYATADGGFLAVGALEDKFWTSFCDVLALPQVLRGPRMPAGEVIAAVAERVGRHDREHWRSAFAGRDCCCTVVASLEEAVVDPHFRGRGLFDAEVESGGAVMPALTLPLAPAYRRPHRIAAPFRSPDEQSSGAQALAHDDAAQRADR